MWKSLKNHFATGLVALGPLFLAIIFVGYLVRLVDSFIVNPVFRIMPHEFDTTLTVLMAKVTITIIVALFVVVIGWTAEKFIFKRIFLAFEGFLETIPFFNSIYSSIKEVAQAFFGDKRGAFKRVVFVQYPSKGIYALAFVTQDKPWEINDKTGKEMLNIFVPSPPNPATGFFVFVPREEAIDSDMTIEEGIRMVISAGAAIPSAYKKR